MTQSKKKLNWDALRYSLCPKCGQALEDPIDDLILCSSASSGARYDCGFVIREWKLKKLLADMAHRMGGYGDPYEEPVTIY